MWIFSQLFVVSLLQLYGNSVRRRIASRLPDDYVNIANLLLLTLPGTAFSYYGDEIGMHDVEVSNHI